MLNDPSFKYVKKAKETRKTDWYRCGAEMIERQFPVQLELELNTDCNLRCPKCPQSKESFKKERLDYYDTINCIAEGSKKGLESIKLQYRGEPLLYPYLIEVIRYAKSKGIYVHFNTNATLLTKNMSIALIKAGLDKIICSIDGCTKETYEKARRSGTFENIVQNITILQAQKQVLGSNTPFVRVQAVKQELNQEEIESGKYITFWSQRADELGIEQCFDFYDNTEDATPLPEWHCEQLWQRLFILADGRVLPCCAGISYEYDTTNVYSVGNIHKETLENIWHNKEMSLYRELHRTGNSHVLSMCRKCRLRKLVVKMVEENRK